MVEDTTRLLAIRRRLLRALYVLTALLILVSAGASIAGGEARFLAGLLFLPLLLAGYLVADTLALRLWRRRMLRSWVAGEMNLGVVAGGLAALPMLPAATMRAMLGTLPVLPPLTDRDLGAEERVVLAAFADLCWVDRTVAALLPASMVAASTAWAAAIALRWLHASAIVACIAAAITLAPAALRFFLPEVPRRHFRHALAALSRNSRERLTEAADGFDPCSVVGRMRHRLLHALGTTAPVTSE